MVPAPTPHPAAPPQPPPRSSYLEALAQYERGVEALQRHDFATAAEHLRRVVDQFPDERELHERSLLYLNVCQQRLADGRAVEPSSIEERMFAATLAMNAGRHDEAISQLLQVEQADPEHDYAQYLLAVAFSAQDEPERALQHLRRAMLGNPENRAQALSDPDLATLRGQDGFRALLESIPVGQARRRARGRSR